MARLAGTAVADVQANRIDAARRFAEERGGAHRAQGRAHRDRRPLRGDPGQRFRKPGHGDRGTGDVLAGVLAAWLAQAEDAEAATSLAVHLHGLAGDLAAKRIGETALVAGDVADHLGAAVLALAGG